MRSIGHFIAGREVAGTSGRFADVFEPMTGEVQAKVALATKAELRAAVENARDAQRDWAATNPQRRARVLMKFLELAQRDYDKLAELLARRYDAVIDDSPAVLRHLATAWPATRIFVYDRPWNRAYSLTPNMTRVAGWAEIVAAVV